MHPIGNKNYYLACLQLALQSSLKPTFSQTPLFHSVPDLITPISPLVDASFALLCAAALLLLLQPLGLQIFEEQEQRGHRTPPKYQRSELNKSHSKSKIQFQRLIQATH